MLTAYRVGDIRTAEAALAATLPEGELMRRAAQGLADAAWIVPAGEVLLVLVGPGNNGGDALCAAAHLLDRGVRVDLCLLDRAKVHADGLSAALAAGAQVVESPTRQRWCLDAIFGIGARSGLDGRAADWAAWLAEHRPYTIAVDVPSGLDVDGATVPPAYVRADHTVTFGAYKNALLVDPAASAVGSSELVDIGLGPHLASPTIEAIETTDGHLLSAVAPRHDSHKYSRGVVGVAAGSQRYAGAAHLCVSGAQAGLAGMVRFVGEEALAARVVDRAPEIVVGRGRVQAWVVGPGGGDDAEAQLTMALDDRVPVVIDASALSHLPDSFDVPVLLTPHAGELAEMLGTTRSAVEADPLGHVTAAAERWQATVLLKGGRTLIAHPDAPTRVNLSGSAWLGTAGSGDVLAGFAGSLLAAGLSSRDAGSIAAFLHGAAGQLVHSPSTGSAGGVPTGGPITASRLAARLPYTVGAFLAGTLELTGDGSTP